MAIFLLYFIKFCLFPSKKGSTVYNLAWGIYSICLLLEAKNITGLSSFTQLWYHWFGRPSIFVIWGWLALGSVGIPIIYFKIFGEAISSLPNKIDSIKDTFWASKSFAQITLGIVLFIFIIQKKITKLKIAGFLLLLWLFFFVIWMMIRLISGNWVDTRDFNMSKIKFGK